MSTINPFKRPFVLSFAQEAEGGDGSVSDAATDVADQSADTQDQASQDAAADAAGGGDAGSDEGREIDGEYRYSQSYVEKLRREAATTREKAKTDAAAAAEAAKTELAQSIGKALGLIKDDETPDPDALVAQAQTERQSALEEARATKVELAVLRNADKHDANTEELLDSRDFTRKLKDLDPTAADFTSQVDELIKAAVDSNPGRFKRVQVAGSSGGSDHSGDGDRTPPGDKSIDDIRKDRQKRRGF